MKLVIVETPWAPSGGFSTRQRADYSKRAVEDSLRRGESPISFDWMMSVDGLLSETRHKKGWIVRCDHVSFYVDQGWTPRMESIKDFCKINMVPMYVRNIEHRYSVKPEGCEICYGFDLGCLFCG